jgi:cytochrome-b5 reductase
MSHNNNNNAAGAQSQLFGHVMNSAQENPLIFAIIGVTAVVTLLLASRGMVGKAKAPKTKTTLKKDEFLDLKLAKKIVVTHDTAIFRFALPSADHILGLPIGQHLMVTANIKGSDVQRSYTPISSDDDKGFVDLMIKVYRAGVHPKFPDGGLMSQHMDSLREGIDTLKFRGPTGRFEYKGRGLCINKGVEKKVRKFGMIAGGTGITPLLQVLRAILKDSDDKTEVGLLFANQTEDDILLRAELEECAKDPRVKIWYTLDRPPAGWVYSEGFISQDMITDHLPAAGDDVLVLMCGPPPMITYACKPNLEKAGYNQNHYVVF